MRRFVFSVAVILALVASLLGCTDAEVALPEQVEGQTRIDISLPKESSKTYLGGSDALGRKVYWCAGDRVTANGVVSDALEGGGGASASFTFPATLEPPYSLLYPASFYKDPETITLPSLQTYAEDSFGADCLPMAGLAESAETVSINHLACIIKIPVLKDSGAGDVALDCVVFSANAGEQVAGDFAIDYTVPSIVGADASEANSSLTLNVGQPLSETEPLNLYLSIPAGIYSGGFTVVLRDEYGREMTKTRSVSTTLSAGHLTKMSQFAFIPSEESSELTIEDVVEDVLAPDSYTLTGRVVDTAGKGIEGVVVNDGTLFTKTLSDGSFYLETDVASAKFVSISSPSGYMPPVENGIPKFYKLLSSVTPSGGIYDCGDFVMTAVPNPDRYTLLITADPQPRKSNWGFLDKAAFKSLDVCEDLYDELYDVASGISGRQVYGICLGDLVHDTPSLFENYAAGLARVGFPTYNVIGNHDHDTSASDDDAGAAPYEAYFGPRNYSFNIGKIHYVVLDNLIMKTDASNDNKLTAYDQGLTDEVWLWLKHDLSYIPKSTKLMVCAHSPMFKQANGSERTNTANHGADYGGLINSYAEVHAWAGHTHIGFNYIYPSSHRHRRVQVHTLARSTGELWTNEYLAEGTPRGFTVVEVDGEEISWRFHPNKYQKASFVGVSSGYTSLEPTYQWRDWDYSGGVAYMRDGGGQLDETYQLHAYPRRSYGDDYVYANVFLWDSKWSVPVFTPAGGEPVEMTLVNTADNHSIISDVENVYDLADTEFRTHYKTYCSGMAAYSGYKVSGAGEVPEITTLFRVPVSASPSSGIVSVTDRFGNTYSRTVSW